MKTATSAAPQEQPTLLKPSKYTQISNRLGWDKKVVAIPTIEHAKELYIKTANANEKAFEEVVSIHRFAENPKTDDECMALKWIWDAYGAGQTIFRDIY